MGFGGLAGDAPDLATPLAVRAVHCWTFCQGWQPAAWPVYAALYPVDDWHQLVDAMLVIRRNV